MILIIHKKARKVLRVKRHSQDIVFSGNATTVLWKLASDFPEETLVWVEKDCEGKVDLSKVKEGVGNERSMISYAVSSEFLSEAIGYIDQLPFITVNPDVRFPTWRMSSDVGAIRAKTLLHFKKDFSSIKDLDYLLNSIAKVGQQNGLFCYSFPELIKVQRTSKPAPNAGNNQLFSFVYRHYKTVWTFVLFFCLIRYEKKFPVFALLRSFFEPKLIGTKLDFDEINVQKESETISQRSIDVILPTLGRKKYLEQVIEDLSKQTLLPRRVIIIEQNPEIGSSTELKDLVDHNWPFQIVHHFTNKTGACSARNKALAQVESEWVFFADDDIRLHTDLLEKTLIEAERLGVSCLNLNCKQPGEKTIFSKIKQWGSFGSGTSVVKSNFAVKHKFSEVFEHGYGEDVDYGMKLRTSGCDIIYHPDLMITHLKAPVGGFREKPVLEWEKELPKPKPSPTVMILAKRYFSCEQVRGFKISLYLKFFKKQQIRNPWTYLKEMEKRWEKSERWAERLQVSDFEKDNGNPIGNEVHNYQ